MVDGTLVRPDSCTLRRLHDFRGEEPRCYRCCSASSFAAGLAAIPVEGVSDCMHYRNRPRDGTVGDLAEPARIFFVLSSKRRPIAPRKRTTPSESI